MLQYKCQENRFLFLASGYSEKSLKILYGGERMFVIKVEKKGRDERFNFEDILKSAQVIHDGCYGGKVKVERRGQDWDLRCERCGAYMIIRNNWLTVRLMIVQTAIDGRERRLRDISVVQKS